MSDIGAAQTQLLGIWGGTFDPVHNGHVQLALELTQTLDLNEMRMMPCNIPSHRAEPIASAAQRTAMLQLAIEGFPQLRVDNRELLRGGVSYTVDTLESLRSEYSASTIFVLCMGADAFADFDRWLRYADILALAHIAVVQRDNTQPRKLRPVLDELLSRVGTQDKACLLREPAGTILQCHAAAWPIASTDIRQRLMRGDDVASFIPSNVMDFIQQQQLYQA